ncbi:hypothetical protein SASPL_118376 [Salvia splendens]|uniref:Uncharacterized protein n=1 Tax=Salvia splendens TaxID=180675 RepID=A0A8X8XZA4_SALSN|nr:hypothetical protein SASPL_118376 [Salvia splendens]
MGMASEIDRKRKFLLGIGYSVQGLRCFPWMGVNFFLKDGMRVAPATLQILQNSANLPMVAKPLYDILSDCVYVFAEHRIPYIAFGGNLMDGNRNLCSIRHLLHVDYILSPSIVEVANDAMVAETVNQPTASKKDKSSSIGGVLGNLVALTGTMLFYQTQHLKIESSLLGISQCFSGVCVVYNRYLKSVSSRKLIIAVQGTMLARGPLLLQDSTLQRSDGAALSCNLKIISKVIDRDIVLDSSISCLSIKPNGMRQSIPSCKPKQPAPAYDRHLPHLKLLPLYFPCVKQKLTTISSPRSF